MHRLTCIQDPMLAELVHDPLIMLATEMVRVRLHIQPESEKSISVLWSGIMYNFRTVLDAAGVREAYHDNEETEMRTYYRCLTDINIISEPNRIGNIIKDAFQNLAMKVVVEYDPVKDSVVANWIDGLRQFPCLHFNR